MLINTSILRAGSESPDLLPLDPMVCIFPASTHRSISRREYEIEDKEWGLSESIKGLDTLEDRREVSLNPGVNYLFP